MAKKANVSVKKAVLINAVGKYSSVILQLFFSAFLSRILTPEEFGVVTVINVFVIFFELFSDLGIGAAIIQKRDLDDRDIRHIFAFTFYMGICMALLFCGLSYGVAKYYTNAVYIPLGIILSFSVMLTSWNVVPNALLMKNKQFTSVAIRTIVANVVSYVVAVVMALNGYSYYSLVVRAVVMSGVLFLWNILVAKLNLCFFVCMGSVKKIWNYSLYQFGASIINYFQRNLDNLLVGKYLGEEQLGYYNKSYTLMQYPITYLAQVITPVLHPVMAEHQDDVDYIYRQYMKILKVLSMVGVFSCACFFCASREIVLIMFGEQWLPAVEPFCIISVSIWPQMLTGTVGCIMQSLNNTKNLFKMCTVSLSVSVIGITVGIMLGDLNKLAYCIVAIYYLHFAIYFYALIRTAFKGSFGIFIKEIYVDVISLICLLTIAYILGRVVCIDNMLMSFILKMTFLTIGYAIILLINRRYKLIISIIKGR